MEMHQLRRTFGNSHRHQNRNSNEKIQSNEFCEQGNRSYTRFRFGSCLVPAGRGGTVSLERRSAD